MNRTSDIGQLLDRLSRVLQNDGYADDLKPAQWEALRYLRDANRFSRTPSALTAYLGVTKGTVSQTISALERKGLLKKTGDSADRRQVRLDLTAKGSRLLKHDPLLAAVRAATSLPAAARQDLADGLRQLLKETLRERGGLPFGACKSCRHFLAHDAGGSPHRCSLLDEPLSNDDSERICVEQKPAA